MALLYILAMILLFSVSIFVHELGHFLAARACGMVADVFSIGMGPALWKRKIGATTYKIGCLPIGGYVALPQMDPEAFLARAAARDGEDNDAPPAPPLPRIAPGKKILVAVAGAAGNVILAFVLATLVWVVGKPASLAERNSVVGFIATNSPARAAGLVVGDVITAVNDQPVGNWLQIMEAVALAGRPTVTLRIQPAAGDSARELSLPAGKNEVGMWELPDIAGQTPCHVAAVYPNSGALAAGLRAGDLLLRFDGQTIHSQGHLSQLVEAAAGRAATIEFLRDGVIHTASVTSTYDAELQRHLIGIQFNTLADLDYTTRVHPTPWAQVRDHAGGIFRFLRALTTPATSGAAAGAVGGPVLILVMLWLMVKSSFILAIWFTGFLNVNLAIINLLPLPLLDGGHVIFNLWELATRRPVPAKWIHALTNLFVVLFIGVFLLLVYRDSVRHIVPGLHRWWTEAPDPAPHVFQTLPAATEDSPPAPAP